MRTKVGLAVSGHHGYAVEITLPRDEQELFPSLALHAQLHPGAARGEPARRRLVKEFAQPRSWRLSRLTAIASWVVRAMTTTASSSTDGFSSRWGTNGGT